MVARTRANVTIVTLWTTNLIISAFYLTAVLIKREIHCWVYICSSNCVLIMVLHVDVTLIANIIATVLERGGSQMRLLALLSQLLLFDLLLHSLLLRPTAVCFWLHGFLINNHIVVGWISYHILSSRVLILHWLRSLQLLIGFLLISINVVLVDNLGHGLTFILECSTLLLSIDNNNILAADLCLAICWFLPHELPMLLCSILIHLLASFGFFYYTLFDNLLGGRWSSLNLCLGRLDCFVLLWLVFGVCIICGRSYMWSSNDLRHLNFAIIFVHLG